MGQFNKKRITRVLALLLIIFGLFITLPGFVSLYNYTNSTNKKADVDYLFGENNEIRNIKISKSYSTFQKDDGEKISIELHESDMIQDNPLYEILNTSDNTNNTFSVATPNNPFTEFTFFLEFNSVIWIYPAHIYAMQQEK